jgi:hypothetical protein
MFNTENPELVTDHTDYPYMLICDDAQFMHEEVDADGKIHNVLIDCVVLRNGEGYDITTILSKSLFEKKYFCSGCDKEVTLYNRNQP